MIDMIILFTLPFLASFLSIVFNLPGFYSIFLFLGFPSLYLTFRSHKNVTRIALFSLIFTIPVTLAFDYIMQVSEIWTVDTIFDFKFFGIVPIEQFIWAFLYMYLSIMYYKYFLDKKTKKHVGFRDKKLAISSLSWLFGIMSVLLILLSFGIVVPYLYIIIGILLFIVQLIIFFKYHPKLAPKILETIPYNFVVAIMFEITEVYLKQWIWPGKYYIGWIEFLTVKFPLEEFIFYMILGSAGILMYFELLADDLE
ncbi:hypothetical protein MUP32_01480 [Candidatus Microgenomates bacterium]|nr:hypothetical protein [Candidatus Microgenomates bacterium]